MSKTETRTSRRNFFIQGGAAVGAGVATTVGASALASDDPSKQLRQELECVTDREAIRQLHLTFAALIEQHGYEAAAELFDEQAHLDLSGVSATGKSAIERLFADQYRHQTAATVHSAYRQNTSQHADSVTLSDDRQQATATFHVEAELCTALQDDCTAASMARLQGNVADRRWERGRFEAKYVKRRGEWKMASLIYRATLSPPST